MSRFSYCLVLFIFTSGVVCPAGFLKDLRSEMQEFEKRFDSAFEGRSKFFDTSSFEDSFSHVLKKMRKRTKELDSRLKKMYKRLDKNGFLKVDPMIDDIDDAFEDLKKSKSKFDNFVDKADELTKYDIDIDEKDDFVMITVALPGFKKEHVSAKVGERAAHKALVINAVKQTPKKKSEKKKEKVFQQRRFSISATIGKKSQRIAYDIQRENGHVTISVYLPHDMPTKNCTMDFKDEKLVVKFPAEQEEVHWKRLNFSR